MSDAAVAFLANRKLHVRKNGCTQLVESAFENSVRERAASIERRHAWKTQGRGAMFMGGAFAAQTQHADAVPVSLTGLSAAPDGSLLYSMETDAVSGVFLLDGDGVETRLFHTADFRVRHASLHPDGLTLAVTAFHKDSTTSNIAVLPVHGTEFSEVTEGDSFDQLPRWVPGAKRSVVFQSSGIGRDAAGRFAGLGPCAIQRLNLDSGELDELASDATHDLLQPHQTEDGSLYYIRKPYETGIPDVSLLGSLKDAVLFPFRMATAVLQYFNIFSMMYSGKPLVTQKGALQRRMDPRQMFIYGNLARAQMVQQADEGQGRTPSTWELVRALPAGRAEKLASSVLTFDIASDGSVLYSDGGSIWRLGQDGRTDRLLDAEMIDQVLAL